MNFSLSCQLCVRALRAQASEPKGTYGPKLVVLMSDGRALRLAGCALLLAMHMYQCMFHKHAEPED